MRKIRHNPFVSSSSSSYLSFLVIVMIMITACSSGRSPFRFRFRGAFPDSSSSGFRFHSSKRSYVDLGCRGQYDSSILAQLDGICEDCYNLYREPEVHGMCRQDCFSSQTFRNCLQSLLLEKESEFYMELVQIIGKKK